MERKKVSSSHIRSVGYDASAQILEVELSDGSIWQYSKVPGEVHRGSWRRSRWSATTATISKRTTAGAGSSKALQHSGSPGAGRGSGSK